MFHHGDEAEHPQGALGEFGTRLAAAELAFHGAEPAGDVATAIDHLGYVVADFRRLQAAVEDWFRQNCPELGLDMDTAPTGPAHVSQVLRGLDANTHTLAIRELSARTFNVKLDLEEAATYAGVGIVEGIDPDTARLEHLERAVDRAQAALAVIARDLLVSVGTTPANGGDDAKA
jgi:hypothetical protein